MRGNALCSCFLSAFSFVRAFSSRLAAPALDAISPLLLRRRNATQFEECMNAMQGTPQKRSAAARLPSSAPGKEAAARRGRTPASRPHGDRFIPQRSAMDMDVSHFELTRAREEENNATVNASPAKARPLAPLPAHSHSLALPSPFQE